MQPGLVQVYATMAHQKFGAFLLGSKGETEYLRQPSWLLLPIEELYFSEYFQLPLESFVIVGEIELLQHCFASVMLDREPSQHNGLF